MKHLLLLVLIFGNAGRAAPAPPAPVPPVYRKLKDLHLSTELVRQGRPNVTIVAPASGIYGTAADRIRRAIEQLTGVEVPLAADDSPAAAVPLKGNMIALGNRSTNQTISELYNRFYTLLDLRYPGRGGYVVRTLHNAFGDGRNVIFVGGSDRVGVDAAAGAFVGVLKKAGAAEGGLSVGRLARIKLGKGIRVPADLRHFETWEASKGYGSLGYFGWNSLSKRMAMYYMTGEEFHAREFIRLAFPDEQAKREIAEIDGERIENKDEPLSGPYHYNAHMMVLFWDLIEESPVFTDEERLRVTNAFAKQLNHRKGEGIYGRTSPPAAVGSRHGQWSAVSLYCLGRYFQRGYPAPLWWHCMESAKLHFRPLHQHAWVAGESDNLFWYNTGIAPIFTYLLLTGDRVPINNGVVPTLLRGQEMLISGRQPDWALNSASIGYLHKTAYLMGDGRWLGYRQRTGIDTNVFRLGQSFWPDKLQPEEPQDLVGKWSINRLPQPMWQARNSGIPFDESFQFGSFRSASDSSGDFVLIDGYNGASRNPYHTFAILELRLGGYTLLQGYRNQLLTRADGLVEPRIANDAALKHHAVMGPTATVVGEVPDAAYCNWRRTLALRTGQYALVVDDLTFRADADNMDVQIQWETGHGAKSFADGHLEFSASAEAPDRRTARGGQIHTADPASTTCRGRVATMQWTMPVKKGDRRIFFSLVGIEPGASKPSLQCVRLSPGAAALSLPGPALAVAGEFAGVRAELAVLAKDHLYGQRVAAVALSGSDGTATLLSASSPVDVDWDFAAGRLHLVVHRETDLCLALPSGDAVRVDGQRPSATGHSEGRCRLHVSPGRHVIEGAKLASAGLERLESRLRQLLVEGNGRRQRAMAHAGVETMPKTSPLTTPWTSEVGGPVTDLITVPADAGDRIYAAAGRTVHVLSASGKLLRKLSADGAIRVLHWWPEPRLLLVGCVDEQVIAFDPGGKRKWTFTSQMDPAVYRAAKTYWFKSAPGHEGIHGLYSGRFIDGKPQAFVGSACTLEILDETGKLVRRMPQFWGKVSHFAIVDGPGGTRNLLASRKYNGTNTVAIINSQTLSPHPRGFNSVPAGVTYVSGWSSMNRHHLFYEDLDGDGVKEVLSEINGTWNRVTVWRADGKALYDASFGPGDRIPAKNMRDLDVADLDGDGKQEIVAATAAGLIVALDHQCRKRWVTHLTSPPMVMKCVRPGSGQRPWIVVGCEDGSVSVLNGKGSTIRSGAVGGRPSQIAALDSTTEKPVTLIATDKGQVKAFGVGQ